MSKSITTVQVVSKILILLYTYLNHNKYYSQHSIPDLWTHKARHVFHTAHFSHFLSDKHRSPQCQNNTRTNRNKSSDQRTDRCFLDRMTDTAIGNRNTWCGEKSMRVCFLTWKTKKILKTLSIIGFRNIVRPPFDLLDCTTGTSKT